MGNNKRNTERKKKLQSRIHLLHQTVYPALTVQT